MNILSNFPLKLAPLRVPMAEWLKTYDMKTFWSDLIAGLTLFVFLIPQGMAYSILAGMHPVYGLYTSIVPLYVYAIFGTSRQLSMGPMAITSLLLGVSVQKFGFDEGGPEYVQMALSISFLVGLITLYLGIFRLGMLSNMISPSVLTGFVTASALVIMINQTKYLFGLHVPRFDYNHQTIIYILTHLQETQPAALIMSSIFIILLLVIREWKKRNKSPPTDARQLKFYNVMKVIANMASFIAILVGSFIAKSLVEQGTTMQIVGDVPSGMKQPQYNVVSLSQLMSLFPTAIAIAFVAFAGNWAVAVKYATLNKYDVDATQELLASGLAITLGVFFNAYVPSGGLARTAVNAESGAKTQIASCITATLILISLLSITSLFYYIPMCVLGGVIDVSILSMIDFQSMIEAYKGDKRDCFVMVVTCIFTFFVGITEGLFVGIFMSIAVVLQSSAFPRIATLGKLPDPLGGHYKDVTRFKEAKQIPGIAIIRMDASLYFANVEYFHDMVIEAAKGKFHSNPETSIQSVIIDTSAWIDIDMVGVRALFNLKEELKTKLKVDLFVAAAKAILRDRLRACGFVNSLGSDHFNMSIEDAIVCRPAFGSMTKLNHLGSDLEEIRNNKTIPEMIQNPIQNDLIVKKTTESTNGYTPVSMFEDIDSKIDF